MFRVLRDWGLGFKVYSGVLGFRGSGFMDPTASILMFGASCWRSYHVVLLNTHRQCLEAFVATQPQQLRHFILERQFFCSIVD